MDLTKLKINPRQTMLTKADLKKLPALYSQDGKGMTTIAQVHFFYGGYDFWATELDPSDGTFFGLTRLHETKFGYTSAEELASHGRIERDLYWTPKPLSECIVVMS